MTDFPARALVEATRPPEQRIRTARACLDVAGQSPLVLAAQALMDEALNELERLRQLIDPLDQVGRADRRGGAA